jgi:exo-beta-1,3-glucanase (GH17 family)
MAYQQLREHYMNPPKTVTRVIGALFITLVCFSPAYALYGVNYEASHYDGTTHSNSPVAWDDIDQDFQILAGHFDIVRTYSMDLWNSLRVPRAAKRYGMRMAIGVGWAYNATADNNQQFELFKYVFGTYPDLQDVVDYVIVGNEACVQGNQTAWDQWFQFYQQVDDWVNQYWQTAKPIVTISERDGVWEGTKKQCGGYLESKLPASLPIFANIYPFWANITVADAIGGSNAESLDKKWERLTTALPNRTIIIGETGWPTDGQPGTNPPTVKPKEADSATYWDYVFNTFLKINYPNVTFIAFEAFDEPLKPSEGGSPDLARHWGMYDDVRVMKPNMTFPKNVSVTPKPAVGANVNVVPAGPVYKPVISQVTITTSRKTYTYAEWFTASDGSSGYPWFEYNDLVTINLPAAGHYAAISCSNKLTGGQGIGGPGALNLTWSGSLNHSAPCSTINWANSGVWLP